MMSQETDSFHDLGNEDVALLLEMLDLHRPHSLHAFSYITTLLDWKRQKPEIESHILAPNGDFSDATFFLFTSDKPMLCGTAYTTTEEGAKRLEHAFRTTKRVRWDSFLFTCMPPLCTDMMLKVLEAKKPEDYEVVYGHAMWLPSSDASVMRPSIPPEVYVDLVQPFHSKQINDVWPHKYPGSEKEVEEIITLNCGLGVFDKTTDHLLSWVLHGFYGGLSLAQTEIEYQRKGYASIAVQELSRRLGEKGIDVHLNVVEGNEAGLQFFNKLGYKPMYRASWIFKGNL